MSEPKLQIWLTFRLDESIWMPHMGTLYESVGTSTSVSGSLCMHGARIRSKYMKVPGEAAIFEFSVRADSTSAYENCWQNICSNWQWVCSTRHSFWCSRIRRTNTDKMTAATQNLDHKWANNQNEPIRINVICLLFCNWWICLSSEFALFVLFHVNSYNLIKFYEDSWNSTVDNKSKYLSEMSVVRNQIQLLICINIGDFQVNRYQSHDSVFWTISSKDETLHYFYCFGCIFGKQN